jgi:ribokinase
MSERVVIVGSLSMDLVVQTVRRPEKGETIRGTGFGMFAGGKGNNQAMAAARAGADVSMIGRVGRDDFGDRLLATLKREKVDTAHMVQDSDTPTGIAHITVDAKGDNYIVIAQQSNAKLCEDDINRAADVISNAKVVLMQLEVNMEPLIAAAKLARRHGATVILNPAPAPQEGSVPKELLAHVSLVVPNQPEATQLTGCDASTVDGAKAAGKKFLQMGIEKAIITLGSQGALIVEESSEKFLHAFKVDSIDSTAAGDAFCGALAAALAAGAGLEDAAMIGCAAGALATTKLGAEPSLPYRRDIDAIMRQQVIAAV